MRLQHVILLVIIQSFFACQNDTSYTTTTDSYKGPLFTVVEESHSGIDFINTVKQDARRNILFYEYYLNGGGVAVGDFNKDGLPDLFFTSNTAADQLYINKGNLEFENITKEAGVEGWREGSQQSWSTGATIADVNNDGWLDIYVCKSGAFQNPLNKANLLYINNGAKKMNGVTGVTFTERSVEYGVHDSGHSNQAVFFDADKDGDLDLYVMNHSILFKEDLMVTHSKRTDPEFINRGSGQFYRNEGQKFVQATKEVGMNNYGFGLGLVASDLNHDGFIDLYIANDFTTGDLMYINNGNGTFTERVKESLKHTCFYAKGVDAADINNDGLVDICNLDVSPTTNYISKTAIPSMDPRFFNSLINFFQFPYQYRHNVLHLNQGKGRFSDIAKMSELDKTDWSWSVLLADFDNDSHKDVFVTNGYKANSMDHDFIKDFTQIKDLWGVISEDERLTFVQGIPTYKTKNAFFKNQGDLTFQSIGEEWGMTETTYSKGATYADLDVDGDLDLIVNNLDEKASIYKNNSLFTNYLQIELVDNGQHLPRSCWNAKVTIYTQKGKQYQELTPVRGYLSSVEPILHFGLGEETLVDKIEVEWLDGNTQVVENIKGNQRLQIDKKNASNLPIVKKEEKPIFQVETQPGDVFKHLENYYDDFATEGLLPHKNTYHGPFFSKADVNGDSLEDYFIGGASQQAGALFIQNTDGKFQQQESPTWQGDYVYEDMGSVFFDIDNDGDQDLYVVSGGNEFSPTSIYLQDRIYLNDGQGNFSKAPASVLPAFTASGSVVTAADFNNDGWQDIFVGGRMKPWNYPLSSESKLLINEKGKLVDQTATFAKDLATIGMVTTAKAVDFNQDQKMDLVIAGEWMPITFFENTGSSLKNITSDYFKTQTGWWSSIESGDFDNDGDMDFIAGNLGLNYKYNASEKEPFHLYFHDFDDSGTNDIVLGYYSGGTCFPLRGRESLSEEMPFIKDKYPSYKSFAKATLEDIYGEKLKEAYHLQTTNFASSYIRNDGNGQFQLFPLPNQAQISCINGIVVDDFNKDGNLDALIAGNMYDSEVETPRNDAGVGLCLFGDGKGDFIPLPPYKSGFYADKNVKDLLGIKTTKNNKILVANNDDYVNTYFYSK